MSFWKSGFWANGFWASGFWTGQAAAVSAVSEDATAICRFQSLEYPDYVEGYLLLEDGSYLLLEDGGRLELEPAVTSSTVRALDTIACRFFSGKA